MVVFGFRIGVFGFMEGIGVFLFWKELGVNFYYL